MIIVIVTQYSIKAVSYTHLDVYKRQFSGRPILIFLLEFQLILYFIMCFCVVLNCVIEWVAFKLNIVQY